MPSLRAVLGAIGGSLELIGGGLAVAHPEWTWVGYPIMALGTVPLLALLLSYLPPNALPSTTLRRLLKGDEMSSENEKGGVTYNVNTTNNNQQGGLSVGVMNVGKMPFVMNESHMQAIADHYKTPRPVTIGWVASEQSRAAATALADFLRARGFEIVAIQGHMNYVPPEPNDKPIMIVGDTIVIDMNK